MLWPNNSDTAYLARHWACAIDMVELVATLGDCSQPEVGADDQRWDRRAWRSMASLLDWQDEVYGCGDIAVSLTIRQAWGLTVRCERAIRAAAPHWGVLEAGLESGWSDAVYNTCLTTSRLLAAFANGEAVLAEACFTEATAATLLQLLTSNAATLIKLAWHTGKMDKTLFMRSVICLNKIACRCSDVGPAFQRAITAAGPTIFFLLAPRHIALAIQSATSQATAWVSGGDSRPATKPASGVSLGHCLHWMVTPCCSLIPDPRLSLLALTAQPMTALLLAVMEEAEHSPEWITPDAMDDAVASSSHYSELVAVWVHQLANCGCEEAAPGSAQLRDLLAQPVLCLLGSSLLDQLAMLQHAPSGMMWTSLYCPSSISPLNRSDGFVCPVGVLLRGVLIRAFVLNSPCIEKHSQ